MPAFSRDTLSPSFPADAFPGVPDPVVPWSSGTPGPGRSFFPCLPGIARPRLPELPAPPPARTLSLPASPRSAALARRFSRLLLAEWGLDELTDDAALLLSELVTNAVVHVPDGTGGVELALTRTSVHLLAQVTDCGAALPACSLAGDDSEGGRGMWLVEQIADQWGHHASPEGKTVWFALPLPGA